MREKTRTGEKIRQTSGDDLYVVLKPGTIPNVVHFGRKRHNHAHAPLGEHVHPGTLEICYLDGGEQVFFVNGVRYLLRGGDLFITHPDEMHSSGLQPMEKSVLYWVGIDLTTQASHFLGYSEPEIEELRATLCALQTRHFEGDQTFREILDKAFDSYLSSEKTGPLMFRNYLTEFLLAVCRRAHAGTEVRLSSLMRGIQEYVEKKCSERLTVADLAQQAQLSLPRFKQRFKQEVGVAPSEFILRRKVERGRSLLVKGDRNVTSVALDLGFSSSQYFATVFKRYTGESPGKYAGQKVKPSRARM